MSAIFPLFHFSPLCRHSHFTVSVNKLWTNIHMLWLHLCLGSRKRWDTRWARKIPGNNKNKCFFNNQDLWKLFCEISLVASDFFNGCWIKRGSPGRPREFWGYFPRFCTNYKVFFSESFFWPQIFYIKGKNRLLWLWGYWSHEFLILADTNFAYGYMF